MDVKLINPFIDATLNVLQTMAFTKAEAGKPYLKNDRMARGSNRCDRADRRDERNHFG